MGNPSVSIAGSDRPSGDRLSRNLRCGWSPSSRPAAGSRQARCAATRSSRSIPAPWSTGSPRGDLSPAAGRSYPLADVTLLAPVPRPRAIFGIGRNYAAHAAELGNVLPKAPLVFMKLPTSSVPPAGPVRCPAVVTELDYEAELAVVIGAGGKIAGWAVADDVSARDLQDAEEQWTRAKGFDTSCPWGPWLTTVEVGGWVYG